MKGKLIVHDDFVVAKEKATVTRYFRCTSSWRFDGNLPFQSRLPRLALEESSVEPCLE